MIDDPLLKSEANQAFEAMIQLKMNKQIDPAGMTRGCHAHGNEIKKDEAINRLPFVGYLSDLDFYDPPRHNVFQ